MSEKLRAPFVKQAKEVKSFGSGREGGKYTSYGIAVSDMERERTEFEEKNRNIIRTIQTTVVDAFANSSEYPGLIWSEFEVVVWLCFYTFSAIGLYEFVFISGNHFIKIDKDYLPAELAMIRFTVEKGIINQFYTPINPGKIN